MKINWRLIWKTYNGWARYESDSKMLKFRSEVIQRLVDNEIKKKHDAMQAAFNAKFDRYIASLRRAEEQKDFWQNEFSRLCKKQKEASHGR